MILTRYIFIFWLKNPSAFNDDFWFLFVNIWTVGFTFISDFSHLYLPGRQRMEFYICTGKLKICNKISLF